MSLHADLHGNAALQSGTRCWNRTGAAIRMAQDLGLHRDASGKDELSHDAFFLEQKRRIWDVVLLPIDSRVFLSVTL